MTGNREIIDRINKGVVVKEELVKLLGSFTDDDRAYAASLAREISEKVFNKKIYIRGLVEISNYCKNNCLYCGIRCSNASVNRYRLSKETILACCEGGFELGFRTFVLQGGEDSYFSDDYLVDIIGAIKGIGDCAVTRSLGERSRESYQRLFDAGADRYLLRHETADKAHYQSLHPENMSFDNRMRCLEDLKAIGYQTGCGFMVGSPYQSAETISEDLIFINSFKPQMVGIGPFIPHKQTPFGNEPSGDIRLCLFLLSLVRIMLKDVLLPSTTALATLSGNNHCEGILHGANVVMPNLTPPDNKKEYSLYDNKVDMGIGAGADLDILNEGLKKIGYSIALNSRGDFERRYDYV